MRLFLVCMGCLFMTGSLSAQYVLDLDAFHKLSVFGNLKVRLVKGEASRIEFPYEDFLPERFKMELSDEKLSLRLVDKIPDWDETTYVVLTYTDLDEIWVHAGARLFADQPIEAEEIKLEGSMGAQVELELYADRLETYVTEGAQVELTGKIRAQRLKVATGGMYKGYHLEAERVEARAKTGAVGKVWATQQLKASAYTGGTINYKGQPKNLDVNSGVAGTIRRS